MTHKFGVAYEVATLLHQRFCTNSHIDGCGWYYMTDDLEAWNVDVSRGKYLRMAKRLLGVVNEETALEIAKVI